MLSHFFTQAVWNRLLESHGDALLDALLKCYFPRNSFAGRLTNREVICRIYSFIKKYYRNEYFYRNVLLQELILRNAHTREAVAYSQFPVAGSRADFVVINGHGAVYEIKTDYDSFYRLQGQIRDYYRVFDTVNLVVGETMEACALRELEHTSVGLWRIERGMHLKCLKDPVADLSCLDVHQIFRCLTKSETEDAVLCADGELPQVDPRYYYRALEERFCLMSPVSAYGELKRFLKKRRQSRVSDFPKYPKELAALFYFWPDSDNRYEESQQFMNALYHPVMTEHRKESMYDVLSLLARKTV